MTSAFPDLPAEIVARAEEIRDGRKPQEGQKNEPDPSPETSDLTLREIDVLALIAEGFTDQEVGDRLEIALDTVKTHVKHILRKLEASNRAYAVANGFRNGDLV